MFRSIAFTAAARAGRLHRLQGRRRRGLPVPHDPGCGRRAIDGVDRNGNPRTLDLLDVPDAWDALDVGAYEIQTQAGGPCSAADTVFCNGFEP